MEFKKLIKNTSYLASTRVVQFIAGIFRSKLNAIYLGTEGVGIVGQFLMLTKSSSQFTNLSMSEAVVKQIAENSNSKESKSLIASSIKTYIITVSAFILISTTLIFFFRNEITIYVFGKDIYIKFFYLAILTFPLLIIDSIFFSILKGFRGIKHISSARIGTIISNLIVFIPLIVLYKLKGAIVYFPISFLITLSWNYYFTNKYYLKPNGLNFNSIINAPIKSSFRKEMLTFSGYGLIISMIAILSVFIGRSLIVTNLGIEKIGIYSPIIRWAGLFTGFLMPAFNTYLYPRFCEVKSNNESTGILNDAIRLTSFSLLPLLLFAIPFRFFFIKLFYSTDFLEAAIYLPYHLLGIIFSVWSFVFAQSMTPRGFIKQHSIFNFIYYSLNIILAYLLVPRFGLYGWMHKSVIASFLLFILYFIFLRTKTNFKLTISNKLLMIYVFSSPIIVILIEKIFGTHFYGMIIGPVLFLLTYFLLTNNEKEFLQKKLIFISKRLFN